MKLKDSEVIQKKPSITIKKIKFNNNKEIEFNNDDIVVFVGPNNVGKSKTLKEICDDLREISFNRILIKNISYNVFNMNKESINKYFESNNYTSDNGFYNIHLDNNFYCHYSKSDMENISKSTLKKFYKVLFTFLSTENRLIYTTPEANFSKNDVLKHNIMSHLESDEDSIVKLNKYLDLSFEQAIDVVDDTINGDYSKIYKIGSSEKIKEIMSQNRRCAFMNLKKLDNLHEQGDGIRSAVAILSSLIVNDHSLFLIDEPETFLHPPQASALGRYIVELSENKQCFISTHDIDFIKGLLEKGSKRVKIIKINREQNNNDFYLVNNEEINKFYDDKSLKYSNILNGLFYKHLVLCESESDCRFYSAILESIDNKTFQNTLFCGVGGKDRFKLVIPLLKKLNINYYIISDVDIINNRITLKDILNSIRNNNYNNISSLHDIFLNEYIKKMSPLAKEQIVLKHEINNVFDGGRYVNNDIIENIKKLLRFDNPLSQLKVAGSSILPAGDCVESFIKLKDFLQENNIYILECGEIERLVTNVEGHGDKWVINVFERYPDLDDHVYDEAKKFLKNIFKL